MGQLVALALCVSMVLWAVGLFMATRNLGRHGFRFNARTPKGSPGHLFDPARASTFKGGARIGLFNASPPFMRLTFDDSWAYISGMREVWVDRSQVTAVRAGPALFTSGVFFASDDGRYDGILFWTRYPTQLLDALTTHGWPVEL